MRQPIGSPADPLSQAEESALYLDKVRALAPAIAAAGAEIDATQRIPEPVLTGMVEAGLFRLFLPRSVGGAEAHPLTFMQVVEALAAVEASPAWNVGQNAVTAIVAAYLAPEAARRVFGDPRAILAWGPPGPGTKAVKEPGGYRVTGNWSFASGGRHATWLGAYCPLFEADGTPCLTPAGTPVRRVMLFPAEQATWSNIWDVVGLRGTASDRFDLDGLFVPAELSITREDLSENREPGWLYRFTHLNLFSAGFASVALGVAQAMLDAFIQLATEKTPRAYRNKLMESPVAQSDAARAEARLRACRAYIRTTMADICEAVRHQEALTMEQRIAIRLAATHVIQEATEVGTFAYNAAGATSIFASSPFERRFRDLHTITQQVQGRASHFETVGRHLMGLEVETWFH